MDTVTAESAHMVTGAGDLGATAPTTSSIIEDPAPVTGTIADSVPIAHMNAGTASVKKAKKSIKKAKARDKQFVGGVSTGSGEVEGESNSSNVNASGQPIRERKKKEPMGAAYEREVEKWVRVGRK
jgi:hypothetical protein